MLRVIISVFTITLILSCQEARVVTMPFRNYGISAERLMPLTYSDAKQSLRVWVSRSTSIDTVYTAALYIDSSFSAYSIKIGQKYRGRKKVIDTYSITPINTHSNVSNFFNRLDSLNLFSLTDQKEIQLAEHQPLSLYIVEYLKDKKYVKFSFQTSGIYSPVEKEKYQKVEDFIKKEFHFGAYRK